MGCVAFCVIRRRSLDRRRVPHSQSGQGAALVFVGLVSLLILAVYSGQAMHGRVNPAHLITRIAISVLIIALALSSWDGS